MLAYLLRLAKAVLRRVMGELVTIPIDIDDEG